MIPIRKIPLRMPSLRMASLRTISLRTISPRFLPRALSLAASSCAALPVLVGAQVTYFQNPPTPTQLRAALLAPATQPAPAARPASGAAYAGGNRTRGIVWQASGSDAGPTAPASANTAPPVAAVPPQLADPGGAALQAGMVELATPAAALPINFDLGSSRVERSSLPYLETIASVLRTDRSLQLVIEGHTDDRGSYSRNMVLSWDRALGVFRTLVETYGIDPRRLQPHGKGPLEPMPGTDPSDAANRRVQFRVRS